MDPLTPEQIQWARQQMSRWLRLRAQHQKERNSWGPIYLIEEEKRTEAFKNIMTQVAADVDHSSLLDRLLRGKEPLEKPPSLSHSYPVYPDDNV